MLQQVITKIFGDKNDRELKKLKPMVAKINGLEAEIKPLSDDQLKAKTQEFKDRYNNGESLDDMLPEAFAVVREAAIRVLGMRHFDVQLIGGMILHRGSIAEMKTGEGKTLTATLAVYLNALSSKGVHVVTVNDYLAQRDAEWMGSIYRWMGLTVGIILHGMNDEERRAAYACDITYGTNNELGFDYLRDNMKYNQEGCTHRGFNYAIVDEVDSVLIDEARTPLIISGPSEDSTEKYYAANEIVKKLETEGHYTVDEKDNHALFTEDGIAAAERHLGLENLYDPSNIDILHAMEQSLKAHHLFKRDIDYLVEDGQVVIIDQHTGRKMPGRRYSDGLHQALEAKENVNIEKQSQTLATVTFQNFFRMYDKLSGMTGTAVTEAPEFLKIYSLEVFVIPTNKPIARIDHHDQVYRSREEKFEAIADEIETQHKAGRPILVGTIAIETSEFLSQVIRKRGVKHVVLNAKFHEQESEIVSQAGRRGAVTIATNMAGRGTDIVLGGNPEMLAKAEHAKNPDADYEALLDRYTKACAEEKKNVLDLGGLYILGTERHESRRIDNQLRGRAGRQGDPGESKFFLSLEDNLMRLFGSPRLKEMMARNMEPGVPIEHGMVSRAIEKAQKSVEARNFEVRKHVLDYDDVMNKQRTTFYKLRHEIMKNPPRDYLKERAQAIFNVHLEEWAALEGQDQKAKDIFVEQMRKLFMYKPETTKTAAQVTESKEGAFQQVWDLYCEKWDRLEISGQAVSDQERFIVLYVIDLQWKDHMRNMDYLKEGISLRGYAQKDPLIEYKKESYTLFNDFMDRMDEEVVRTLFHLQPRMSEESVARMKVQRSREERAMKYAGNEEADAKPKTVRRAQPKVGRNAPCPCGSGKKYKHCHGKA